MIVYHCRLNRLLGDGRWWQFGDTWTTLDAAQRWCETEMRYDPGVHAAFDHPTWFNATPVVSSWTGYSGTTYARIYHLEVRP